MVDHLAIAQALHHHILSTTAPAGAVTQGGSPNMSAVIQGEQPKAAPHPMQGAMDMLQHTHSAHQTMLIKSLLKHLDKITPKANA